MKTTAIVIFIYALLILVGGWMGYAQARSTASLISGIAFGLGLSLCSLWISKGRLSAHYIALILTFFLDAFFTFRFAKTHHFLPAGMMSLISLAMLIFLTLRIKKKFNSHR